MLHARLFALQVIAQTIFTCMPVFATIYTSDCFTCASDLLPVKAQTVLHARLFTLPVIAPTVFACTPVFATIHSFDYFTCASVCATSNNS